ncbi:MAG: hypothetical protein ACK5HA_04895, partial [Planctomycetaceae bacterium]
AFAIDAPAKPPATPRGGLGAWPGHRLRTLAEGKCGAELSVWRCRWGDEVGLQCGTLTLCGAGL